MKTLANVVKKALILVASLSVVSIGLYAQDFPQRGPIPFNTYDVNKDGLVSESEFYDTRAAKMTQKAKQGMPMRNAANAPKFSYFDTNKDGKLTKVELLEGQNKRMQKNRGMRQKGQGQGQR